MKPGFLAALLSLLLVSAATASSFALEMMNATFKIYHPDSTSTCFLVRRDDPGEAHFLVTTAHTLDRIPADTAVVVLREELPDGSLERRDCTVSIRRDGEPLWVRHEDHDVAVLPLDGTLPVPVEALPQSALANDKQLEAAGVNLGHRLFVLTFPERFEGNTAGIPVARQGIFATPPRWPATENPTFLADFTTFAGDSGGPVFVAGGDGHPLVVGMVLERHHHNERTENAYEERLVRHSLGLGSILRAEYILSTIEIAENRGPTAPSVTLERADGEGIDP